MIKEKPNPNPRFPACGFGSYDQISGYQVARQFMEDEGYPAYLKQQTIDDLVDISANLDQQAQPKRYAMVLAELAEREKRGERPTPPGRRNREYDKVRSFIATLVLFGMSAVSIHTGRISLRRSTITRSQDPRLFWALVSLEILGALFFFYGTFTPEKDEN